MTQTLSAYYRSSEFQKELLVLKLREAKGIAQVLRLDSLLLMTDTKQSLQMLWRKTRKIFAEHLSTRDILFLSGVERGWNIQNTLKKKSVTVDYAVFAALPLSFFTGILLGLAHAGFAPLVLYLPPKDYSKKDVLKTLKHKLRLLRDLATVPVMGLDSASFDVFPYYLSLDPLEKQAAKRKRKLFSLREKSKLKKMSLSTVFGLEDIVRFFGRENSYLLAHLAKEEGK